MGRKAIWAFPALLAMSIVAAFTAFAASEFEGTWTGQTDKGAKFEITLSADGKVTSTHPEDKSGTWTEDGGTATIKWDGGRTTKITKQDDHYVKQFISADGKAAQPSPIEKKQ
jgi:hypothetical protein